MSRKLFNFLMIVGIPGCFVVGATIGWPNMANSAGGEAFMKKVDFDHTFNATVMQRGESALTIMTKLYFDPALTFAIVTLHRENSPTIMTKQDFDRTFATPALPHRENTPPNREKVRDEGWKRILGSRRTALRSQIYCKGELKKVRTSASGRHKRRLAFGEETPSYRRILVTDGDRRQRLEFAI